MRRPEDPPPEGEAHEREEEEFVSIRLGATEFGLPVDRVLEVVRVPEITRLPFPPPCVVGVAGVRGTILPVLDLGERLLGRPSPRDGRLLIVEDPASGSEVALLVDSVPGLVVAAETATSPPAEIDASLPSGWIAGVIVSRTGSLVTLLELAPVLALNDSSEKES